MSLFVGMTHRKVTTLILLLGGFLISFPITLLVVTLPTIAEYFDTSVSIVSWIITGPFLAFGVVGIAFGRAGDLWGHRKVFVSGLFLTGLFGLLSALAWNPLSLITFRVLSAAFGSATGPSAMAFFTLLFRPDERMRPYGLWNFACAVAPVIGVLLGSPLVDLIGWQIIFYLQGPFCMVAAIVARKYLEETKRQSNIRFDIGGSSLLAAGSLVILLAINRGSAWGWSSPWIIALLFGGVVLLFLFTQYERNVAHPLFPLHWLSERGVALPILTHGLLNFSYMGSFLIVAQMLSDGLGYSTQHVGWLVISRPLAYAALSPFSGRFVARLGHRLMGVFGASSIVVAALPMSLVRGPGWDVLIVLGLGLTGVGLALASPSLTSMMSFSVERTSIGIASALMQLSVHLGAVIGGATMIAIQESTVGLGLMTSYGLALSSGALAGGLAVILARKIRNDGYQPVIA